MTSREGGGNMSVQVHWSFNKYTEGRFAMLLKLFFSHLKENAFVTMRPTLLKSEQKIMESVITALERGEFPTLYFRT